MRRIELTTIDSNLAADLNGDASFAAFEATDEAGLDYHIVFNRARSRGGLVYVGSGSNGQTHWTDAKTVEEVLEKYLLDEMQP